MAFETNVRYRGRWFKSHSVSFDVAKFCKGLGDDPGLILDCLEKNKDKIAEKCQNVIVENDKPAEKKDEKPADNKPAEKK